jgi:glucose/arabinose dehydrogenase
VKRIALFASLATLTGLGAAAAGSPGKPYRLVPVVTGLKEPVYVTTPRSQPNNLYIVERTGRVRVRVGQRLLPKPFLDLRGKVATNTEQGLLSLAFHPQYRQNHRFFVYYTDRHNDIEIVEYRARGYRAIPGSARRVLLIDHPSPNHNGGLILFGPGGYLYTGIGDGGGAGDPENDAQNLDSPLGKLLRLNVDVDPAHVDVVGYGLRNPWRFSFDRANGDLYLGDVGQDSFEEIDYTPRRSPGLENYGWHVWEAFSRYKPDEEPNPTGRLVFPIAAYGRKAGATVVGGFVYRSKAVPAARGRYFYGDFSSGRIWSLRVVRGRAVERRRERLTVPQLASFSEGPRGELYFVSFLGTVWRLSR